MRPTPIPDDELDGMTRSTIGPPQGHDLTGDIRPVEAAVEWAVGDIPIFNFRFVLDAGDLERLAAGEPFWLSLWGHVVPFAIALAPSDH